MGNSTSLSVQRPDFSPNQMVTHLASGNIDKGSIHGLLSRRNRYLNRIYSVNAVDRAPGFDPSYYPEPLMYGEEPYFCPNGWRRYAIDLGLTDKEFRLKYENWPVAYHGTSSTAAADIIVNGFRANNNQACFIKPSDEAVFLTPSIKYAGHPRYAKVERVGNLYVQLALQVRVQRSRIMKKPGTIEQTFSSNDCLDPNFKDNNELEWIFVWDKKSKICSDDGIIVYGVMARITDTDPRYLPENQWWEESRNRLGWDRNYSQDMPHGIS